MNLKQVAEMGYTCGLHTLGEAIMQVQMHWDAWPPGAFEELNRDIATAGPNVSDVLCVDYIGAERCAEMDRELAAYFDSVKEIGNNPKFSI